MEKTNQSGKKEQARSEDKGDVKEESPQKSKEALSVEELTDLLKRTQANFDNYRKQMQAFVEESRKMAAKDMVLKLLPVIDNFELALKSVDPDQGNKEFIQGMQLIHDQLMKTLEESSVVPM